MSSFSDGLKRAVAEAAVMLTLALVLAFSLNALRPGGLPLMPGETLPKGPAARAEAPRIHTADECLRLFKQGRAVFLDAREEALYTMGHLPGALHVPKERVDQLLPRLRGLEKTGKVLIAYCDGQGCTKAEELVKILRAKGFNGPGLFADGWQGWMDKGYPVDGGGG